MTVSERFQRLRELPADWDSYGAPPIDAATIDRAERFLRRVNILPCSDGAVQLEWHSDGLDIEITFEADGTTDGLMIQRAEAEAAPPRSGTTS